MAKTVQELILEEKVEPGDIVRVMDIKTQSSATGMACRDGTIICNSGDDFESYLDREVDWYWDNHTWYNARIFLLIFCK